MCKTIFVLFIFLICSFASAKQECQKLENFSVGQNCFSKIRNIHPTQFSLGYLGINKAIENANAAYLKNNLDKYLDKKIAPGVIGPDLKVYILDRHHTSRGILDSIIPQDQKNLKIKILYNWSDLSWNEFYTKMNSKKYFYLFKNGVGPLKPEEIPHQLSDLEDDPYRSLAIAVRKAGGFKKVNIKYLEFYWANFFRKSGIILHSSSIRDINQVLQSSFNLARSNHASHLPGYIKN